MASIEIENLTKRYGAATALDNVSLKIESGEFWSYLDHPGVERRHYYVVWQG